MNNSLWTRLSDCRCRIALVALAALVPLLQSSCCFGQVNGREQSPSGRLTSQVSPALEIEVLDPHRDPKGNPAIQLGKTEQGFTQVDIAPSVIVHRYYYTGDRSFRGPELPGGPTVVVVTNPRTGERCYIEVQMLPGAPQVHYTQHRIEYDFGNRAILLDFPWRGSPKVSVRNGRPLTEKVAGALKLNAIKSAAVKTGAMAKAVAKKTQTAVRGAGMAFGEMTRPITLPMQNLARMMPGAAMLTDPDLEARVVEAQAIRQADAEAFRVQTLNSPDVDILRR